MCRVATMVPLRKRALLFTLGLLLGAPAVVLAADPSQVPAMLGIRWLQLPAATGYRAIAVQTEPCPPGAPRTATGTCRFGPSYGVVYRRAETGQCVVVEGVGGGIGGPATQYAWSVPGPAGPVDLKVGGPAAQPQALPPVLRRKPSWEMYSEWIGEGPFQRLQVWRPDLERQYPGTRTQCRRPLTPQEMADLLRALQWRSPG